MNRIQDVQVLDAMDAMRRRPEMYIPEGISVGSISARLTSDALLLGARHVRADVVGSWGLVSADIDWLTVPVRVVVPVMELFQRLVIFDEGGPNAARAEAWVGAYCAAAYAVTRDERVRVVGETPLPRAVEEALLPQGCSRTVTFVIQSSECLVAGRRDEAPPAER